MNFNTFRSQNRRGTPRINQQQKASENQKSNDASHNFQQSQSPAPICQPSSIAQPQRNAVNTANLPEPSRKRVHVHLNLNDSFISAINKKTEETETNKDISADKSSSVKSYLNRTKTHPRKIRQLRNHRLRKLVKPKNALMALYELHGHNNDSFKIDADPVGFVAKLLINNVWYEGRGISKMAAKNDVSEKALRDLVIQKMMVREKNTQIIDANKDTNDADDVEKEDTSSMSVEVPMMQLASFALHKLFLQWENDGFEIPGFKTNQQENVVLGSSAKNKSELPANHETMHPSMLFQMMRPNTKYVDLGIAETVPKVVYRYGLTVDGKSFVGQGRSKKLARKAVAISACNSTFGTNFQ